MPCQTVAAHGHLVALGKVDEVVGSPEVELISCRLQGVELHLVLCHEEIELSAYLLCLGKIVVGDVVLPCRDGGSYQFAVLCRITAQWGAVSIVVDAIVIERSHDVCLIAATAIVIITTLLTVV